MPIHILWGNDLDACNKFIQNIIDQKVSKTWKEINVSFLNGDEDNQIKQAFDEILTPPLGDGSRKQLIVLKYLFQIQKINKIQLKIIKKMMINQKQSKNLIEKN